VALKQQLNWQQDAITATTRTLAKTSRCRIIAPTGIGKSALGVFLARNYGRTLITSVRTRILHQYAEEIKNIDPGRPVLVIASRNPHIASISPANIDNIIEWIKAHKDHPKATVLAMYQSSGGLASVMNESESFLSDRWFDLSIMDEAHCSTGLATPSPRHWKHIHAVNSRHASRVISMTATERYIDDNLKIPDDHDIYSQHMEEQYGPVAYEISFAKAVKDGYLADYKIVGMFSSENLTDGIMGKLKGSLEARLPAFLKEAADHTPSIRKAWTKFSRPTTPDEIFKAWCVLECMKKEDNRRCLCFFNRVNEAVRFNEILLIVSQLKDSPFRLERNQVHSLHAETSYSDELEAYRCFQSKNDRPVIVSSVDKLTIGVDFPAADMAAFIEPRKGEVRLPQSAGRITRKDGNKKSTILITGYLSETGHLLVFDGQYANARQHVCREMIDILYRLQKIDSRMISVVTALKSHTISMKSIIIGGGSLPEVSLNLPSELTNSLIGMTVSEVRGEQLDFENRINDICKAAQSAAEDLGIQV
jgi:superfamily II DNA or RNA helicase